MLMVVTEPTLWYAGKPPGRFSGEQFEASLGGRRRPRLLGKAVDALNGEAA
jgi:hypothetical protein